MSNDMTSAFYDEPRDWIKTCLQHKIPRHSIKLGKRADEDGLKEFLKTQNLDNFWPTMSVYEWYQLVEYVIVAEEQAEHLREEEGVAEISDDYSPSGYVVPRDEYSSWQLYKRNLVEQGFHENAIALIEESSFGILKHLKSKTEKDNPVRGLVIGNVQSGKTANMAGVMAMAADYGWNMFIVLSGTIENLRVQTQTRLHNDLNKFSGNLNWITFDHPSKRMPIGSNLSDLHFSAPNNKNRYLTVCLKNKKRLEGLIDWLQKDKDKLSQVKVLVIDDEADQAGINTGDVYSPDDRKTISRLLLDLVFCWDKKAPSKEKNKFSGSYGSMSYISYTATPYANCLNEIGEWTLYPKNFIRTLGIHPEYFGLEHIFGNGDSETETLDIVRNIPEEDRRIVKEVGQDSNSPLPRSMKNSIVWFICATAALRVLNYKHPLSMLIHTSQKQAEHKNIAEAVKRWILTNRKALPDMCKRMYEEEVSRFTKSSFKKNYSNYALPDSEIWDYPEFELILPHIYDLIEEISSITMEEEGSFSYTKSLHLCIDNSENTGLVQIDNELVFKRLAYPDETSVDTPKFATAFIIVGGNTLSRGLTLKGLISTYFIRAVKQADTLMQMARWFGYRRHYELFPRIWLTEKDVSSFEYLTLLDMDLREQIKQLMRLEANPEEFNIAFLRSPRNQFKLSASNRTQMAEACEVDFSGHDTQLTSYSRKVDDLKFNKALAQNFISKIGNFEKSESKNCNYVARNIEFSTIYSEFLSKFRFVEEITALSNIDAVYEWVKQVTDDKLLSNWNIVLAGNSDPKGGFWNPTADVRIGKVERSTRTPNAKNLNLGVLSNKQDYISDIVRSQLSDDEWNAMLKSKSISRMYQAFRHNAKLDTVPLLLIYCVNKDSKSTRKDRYPLDIEEDIIGIAIFTPGKRSENTVKRVHIHRQTLDNDEAN